MHQSVVNPKAVRVSNSSEKATEKKGPAIEVRAVSSSSPTGSSSESAAPVAPSSVRMNKGRIWNEPETRRKSPGRVDSERSESDASPQRGGHRHEKTHLLVEAHEHQLSDITETCKREMNLLSSLKGSQMVSFVWKGNGGVLKIAKLKIANIIIANFFVTN